MYLICNCIAKVVSISFLYIMEGMENSNEIFTVGLTGGIGSGKSTAAKVFKALGIPVFNSDKAAHSVYSENSCVREAVIERFSEEVAVRDSFGNVVDINRKALGKLAFAEEAGLDFLNKLVHPEVRKAFKVWSKEVSGQAPYVIREIAILFESGAEKGCDAVITVSASESQRIERLKRRDGFDIAIIMGKLQAQLSDNQRESRSDFILKNNDSDMLLTQIEKLHLVLKKKALNLSK
tara:strand:+ start:687 stop:1394 length:708 start_codon:yes stop_codon:yes gene_type:complete